MLHQICKWIRIWIYISDFYSRQLSGGLGSIPGRIIPKTLKMILDTSLLNTQQYKVRIKGKVEQYREKELRPPLHIGVVAIEKGALWSPSTTVANFILIWGDFIIINISFRFFKIILMIKIDVLNLKIDKLFYIYKGLNVLYILL